MSPTRKVDGGASAEVSAGAVVSRRAAFRIGLGAAAGAAAAAAAVTAGAAAGAVAGAVATAGPAEATPTGSSRPVFANDFRVTVAGVEVPGVLRVEMAPVRVNLRRPPGGDVEFDYAESSILLRLVADARTAAPLWNWYQQARLGGQPPARDVVVDVRVGSGRNAVSVLTVSARSAFVERFDPAYVESVGPRDGPVEAYDLRCPIGPDRLNVAWVTSGAPGAANRTTQVLFGSAGSSPVLSQLDWSLAAGGAVVLDTGYGGVGPLAAKLPLGASTERLRLVVGMARNDALPDVLRAHMAAILAGGKPDPLDIDVVTPVPRGRTPRTVQYRGVFLESWALSTLDAGADDTRARQTFEFLASEIGVVRPS